MFCTSCGYKNSDASKFCASCGKSTSADIKPVDITSTNNKAVAENDAGSLVQIAEATNCYFYGKNSEELSHTMGESMGVKGAQKLVFNLYASPDIFVVLPASKDRSGLALFGLLLGAGGLAGFALGALQGLAKKLEISNSKIILEQDNPLFNALIFKTSEIKLQAKEIRSNNTDLFYIFSKETWVLASGVGLYKNKEYEVSVNFGFEGQASDHSKKRIAVFDKLFNALKISPPVIHKGKNPPF